MSSSEARQKRDHEDIDADIDAPTNEALQTSASKRPRADSKQLGSTQLLPPDDVKETVGDVDMKAKRAKGAARSTTPTPTHIHTHTHTPKKVDKSLKGLRNLSMLVCRKVEEKGTTTYNEVADELVAQLEGDSSVNNQTDKSVAGNSIRRRVYDALNVLMALDIVTRDKRNIIWKGGNFGSKDCSEDGSNVDELRREHDRQEKIFKEKKAQFQELVFQNICFCNLEKKNQEFARYQQQSDEESKSDESSECSSENEKMKEEVDLHHSMSRIPLPFFLINERNQSSSKLYYNRDHNEFNISFESSPFQLLDEYAIIRQLGLHQATRSELESMFPANMMKFCDDENLTKDMIL